MGLIWVGKSCLLVLTLLQRSFYDFGSFLRPEFLSIKKFKFLRLGLMAFMTASIILSSNLFCAVHLTHTYFSPITKTHTNCLCSVNKIIVLCDFNLDPFCLHLRGMEKSMHIIHFCHRI